MAINENEEWLEHRRNKRLVDVDSLFDLILNGDIAALSKAITLIESTLPSDRVLANKLMEKALPFSGNSVRVGITGVPGVGKSTFIESLGIDIVNSGKKLAVLAIDPSSSISGGSILGDKTRMNDLSTAESVFIRPSPAGQTLGGVGRSTRETIFLCEAAGFDVIFIETVGVGQSETAVKSMVDFFLLLMLAGAGDELQGIKKGIMEMADALVVTKADGDNKTKANHAAGEYRQALHLFPANKNGWTVPVFTCSSLTGENVNLVWDTIVSFDNHIMVNGWKNHNRKEQNRKWLNESLNQMILSKFYDSDVMKKDLDDAYIALEKNNKGFFEVAQGLFEKFMNNLKNE